MFRSIATKFDAVFKKMQNRELYAVTTYSVMKFFI
jgi:hypothetical protein